MNKGKGRWFAITHTSNLEIEGELREQMGRDVLTAHIEREHVSSYVGSMKVITYRNMRPEDSDEKHGPHCQTDLFHIG